MFSRKFALLVVLLAVTMPLCAQELLGGITGTVVDPTGAVIPGASVAVKNLDTNLEVKVTTIANGSYLVPNLPPGNYSVSISQASFKTENHTAIIVEANRTTTVNGKLQVGSVTTTVEVSATPMMNEVDTTNGYVLGEKTILNTPLATGSFTQLAILSPGVNADFSSGSGSNAGLGNQAIWSNGQRDTSNSFSLNGITNNNLFNGKSTSTVQSARFLSNTGATNSATDGTTTSTSVYASIGNSMGSPMPETMQEMRVNTAMYDASQGGKSGAYVTTITKSGTNAFHGMGYEHFQNTVLNAAAFYRNASTAIAPQDKVAKIHYNRFGFTIGGPVLKDKIFFFGAYNRIISHDAQSGTKSITVPIHLTDDRSAGALVQVAQLDSNKTITTGQLDPAAVKLLQFKLPNGSYMVPSAQITDFATASKLGYDVYLQAPATFENHQFVGDLDFNINSKDRLATKFLYQTSPTTSPLSGSSTFGFPQENQAKSMTGVIDNTTILKPSLTWEQKVGLVRMVSNVQTQQPLNPLDVGVNMFNSSAFPALNLSRIDANLPSKSFTLGTFANTANAGTYQNQFSGATTLNWVHGAHTVFAGFNLDQNQLNIVNHAGAAAEVNFATFADFLTGTLQSSNFNRFYAGSANKYFRATIAGAFVQDNIRVSSNFSVSLGLRWDYNGPFTEKYGNLTNFHPELYQYNAATDAITNTGLVVAGNNPTIGTSGISDSTMGARQWGIGPRIGIVWSPSSLRNIVIRTGFGMFTDRGQYFTLLSPPAGGGSNGPFGITLAQPFVQQVIPATNSAGVIIGNLSQPFAGATLPAPVTSLASLNALVPNATALKNRAASYVFGGYDPGNRLPYTENWTFDMQWQPLNTMQMSLGYVGSRSLHQVMPIPFNQPGVATPNNPIHGEIYSYGFNPTGVTNEPLKTIDGGNTDLRTPYLGYATNSTFYKAEGIANYNALQFGVRKRFGKGLQFVGSYTWSHTLDMQSGLGLFFNGNDPANLHSSYATSTYDRPHVISAAYSYEIPSLAKANSLLGRFTNGWIISGVTILQSSFPYNAYDFSGAVGGQYYGQTLSVIDPVLPLKPGVTVKQAQLQGTTGYNVDKPWLDTSLFMIPTFAPGEHGVAPCVGTACDTVETGFGATARNTFRGPFQNRTDAALIKNTKINERFTLQLRGSFFNVMNHPSFDVPNSGSAGLYGYTNSIPAARAFLATFGVINRTIGSPRQVTVSAYLNF